MAFKITFTDQSTEIVNAVDYDDVDKQWIDFFGPAENPVFDGETGKRVLRVAAKSVVRIESATASDRPAL